MASEIKVNKISPGTGTALQISDSGDTVTLPSGATLTIAGTINASTGTATGFGDNLDWQTSDIKTGNFTAVAEKGYLVNTTSGGVTVSLPAGTAGAQIGLVDYAGTWDSNTCTVNANGTDKIQGVTSGQLLLAKDREAISLLYADSTQGWIVTSSNDQAAAGPTYVVATGGTITTDGDYKVHTFTSTGTFTVTCAGSATGSNSVDYLVVAGGGGGAKQTSSPQGGAGAGGAGGLRQNYPNPATGGTPVSAQAYPVTIGAGGAGGTGISPSGAASVWNSVSSAGGGGGAGGPDGPNNAGAAGGSGGGGAYQ